ncbi:radical SAM protein [Prevotella sp. MGM2]|nr:radical SAM protein [Prevotella sp. MGM2]
MDMTTFKNALRFARFLGVSSYIITGGEPTEHPQFYEFCEALNRFIKGSKVVGGFSITSNGTWFPERYAKNIIDSFSYNGVPCGIKDIQQMIADGYIAGAKEALASQWKRPEEEIPTTSHALTFIMTGDKGQIEIANWLNGKYQGSLAMLVNLGKAQIVAWMEIPDMM